jgi:hypothetical protein
MRIRKNDIRRERVTEIKKFGEKAIGRVRDRERNRQGEKDMEKGSHRERKRY